MRSATGPAMIQRIALGANAGRNARRDHPRGDRRDLAIRGLPSRNDTGWSGLLYKMRQREIRAQARAARSCRRRATCARPAPRPASTRSNARWTSSPSRSSSIRSSCACAATRTATRTSDLPYTSKELRECYRQGAEAFGWDKRNPEPRSMRDGSELVGWGMATGVWEALQMPIAVRIVLTANGHAEVACATSDIGTGTYTIMAQVAADMLGLPLENISVKLGDSTLPQSPVEGGSWIAASVSNGDRRRRPTRSARSCCVWPRRCRTRRSRTPTPDDVALADGKLVEQARRVARGVDRGCDAARRRRPHRAGEDHQPSPTTARTRATRIRRSSPR